MNFGFGIGDFLSVYDLANKVRQDWIDAPGEYASIRNETKNVGNILRDIGDLGTRLDLSLQREEDLKDACDSCRTLLEQCEKLADDYSSLQSISIHRSKFRRKWKQFKLDPEDVRHLRDQLSSQVVQLTALSVNIESDLVQDVKDGVDILQQNEVQRTRKTVADWYSPPDFADQQTDQLSYRKTGTGHWFLDHAAYIHWRDHANATLLCPGIPGSGKSVMAATIVDNLRVHFEQEKDVVTVYFYCSFNRQSEQNISQMLASLARQMFQEQQHVPKAIEEIYLKHRDRGTRPSVDVLKGLLRLLVQDYARVFIVIDALDECENKAGSRDQLLNELFDLQAQKAKNVNILATTRIIPEITAWFTTCPKIEIRARKEDIERYLDSRMSILPLFVRQSIKLQSAIKKEITDAADGIFLLARLQFESMRDKTNNRKLQAALSELKRGSGALDDEYNKALDRIEHQLEGFRQLARNVLTWIIYARRELTIKELQEAMAIEPGMTDLDYANNLEDEQQIVSVCAGLVTIDNESQIIRLVHYTTQEYLKKVRDRKFPDGESEITRNCIAYLSMDVFNHSRCNWMMDLSETVKKHSFLDYAGKNWGFHASATTEPEIQDKILKLLRNIDYLRFSSQIIFAERRWYPQRLVCEVTEISPLHVCAYFRLHQLTRHLLDKGANINLKDNYQRTPLSWAAEYGSAKIVQQLLAQSDVAADSKDKYGRTPLSQAALGGHGEIMQLLLARSDVAADSKDEYGHTPLSWAAYGGHTEIVQLLLARSDVAADSKDKDSWTPLSRAADGGHIEIMQLLLARSDVAANLKDKYGRTPLSRAALGGHVEIMQLLLARSDVTANSTDEYGHTPLSWAAYGGHTEIVQLLLARSDIAADSKDKDGWTPLSRAADGGHTEIVQLLLARSDVAADSKDKEGWTPLSRAAYRGHTEIVQLLLARSDVAADSKDKDGRTPLSWAAVEGHTEIVQLLLAQSDVAADLKDKYGWTPLSHAAHRGHTEIMQLLLARSDVTADSKDKNGWTPLSRAAGRGHTEIVQLLLARSDVAADSKDNYGWTPLSRAADGGHTEIVQLLLARSDVAADSKGKDGWTPLSRAADGGHTEIVQLLLAQPDVAADSKDEIMAVLKANTARERSRPA